MKADPLTPTTPILPTDNLRRDFWGNLSHDLRMTWIVIRREVRDSFRDWRIIIPILILTIFFPALMNFTAGRLLNFVEDYGAEIIATQLIPFLMLVVGFFPMSFSLIIALETFAGERERKSMEPLLATPLTDTQLYIGKMVSALMPPLIASYLGMAVYMVGLYFSVDWRPTSQLLIQTVMLSTVQGVIMVAGAVIVSSQTTSVRAANLLASFIIVPMALLIQAEAAALFWGNHVGIWWLILALTITAMVLIRMGIKTFNRESLMGQEIDQIHIKVIAGQLWRQFSGRADNGRYPHPINWYKQTIGLIPELKYPALLLIAVLAGSVWLGLSMAQTYPLSADIQAQISGDQLAENAQLIQGVAKHLPVPIFIQNMRVVLLQTLLGLFTFGVLAALIFMLPIGVLTFLAAQVSMAGEDPFLFLLATVVPHAIVELPTLLLVGAAALRWQVTMISPPPDKTLSEAFLLRAADFARIFIGLVLPLLALAALVEAYITPLVIQWVYSG